MSLHINGELYQANFKKSDVGFHAVKALEGAGLIDDAAFEFLRDNTSCSFQLLKKAEELTATEKKYSKYRIKQTPEFVCQQGEFYIARNWGLTNTKRFIHTVETRFPEIRISIN